jgi:iron complex outermembrane receptor protein
MGTHYLNRRSSGQRTPASALLALTLLCGPLSAIAADTPMLEEVIVTATKRAVGLQDIAVTVTAFSADTIQEAGINDASDVAIMTPSLNIAVNTSPFTARLQIRGIGTAQTDPALEPSVGLFIDGVFMGRSGLGMSDLTDIERIEVLQGPQGTLYGKNTNAGAISIITKAPNIEEFEGYVDVTVGNYESRKITASASGPLADTVAYRASGTVNQRDGYFENSAGDDLNGADDWNLIGKLLWEPTDTLRFLFSGSHVERDANCCGADARQSDEVNVLLAEQGFSVPKNDPDDYKIAVDVDSEFELDADALALVIDYDQAWGALKSITAWNEYDYTTSTDADRSELDVLPVVNDIGLGDSFSQEIRFSSEAGGSFDYQLGLFYYEQTTQRGDGSAFVFVGEDFLAVATTQDLSAFPIPPQGVSFVVQPGDSLRSKLVWENDTIAAFGQATWHVGDTVHITGGLRWTDEEKRADFLGVVNSTAQSAALVGASLLNSVAAPIDAEFKRSSDNLDWLLNASVDLGEDAMVFVSAATGSKSGGFNGVNGTVDEREFDDETTMSYELGVKSTLLNSRLRVNATAFFTEIDDYQSQQQLESGIGTRVSNQAELETSGIDISVEALPLPNLTVTAGFLYMHDYEITSGPDDGLELPFTAQYSGNLSATLVLPLADGGVYIRADYSYMDDHITSTASITDEEDVQDRTLLNLKAGWRNDNWNVSMWAKNLTDEVYASAIASTFPFTGMDAFFLAPPRTYGATLRYDF